MPDLEYMKSDTHVVKLLDGKAPFKVRQISTLVKSDEVRQNYATVILQSPDDNYELHLVNLDTHVKIASKQNVTTAVFNAAEDAIIAGLDAHTDGLAVLDLDTLQE